MSPKDLVSHKEHEQEWGGYFVVKGHERLIRMLLQQRRNYPIAVVRSSWRTKDSCFSDLGIMLRSVREDESSNVSKFVSKESNIKVVSNFFIFLFLHRESNGYLFLKFF